jgi:hypothetical protein
MANIFGMGTSAQVPSWVQQSQQPQPAQTSLGPNATNANMNGVGGLSQAPGQINHNAWDGIGPNTNANQVQTSMSPQNFSNAAGAPISGAGISNMNLPPQIQQILQAFMSMGGGGFQGLQPMQGNPFGTGVGTGNLSQWGAGVNAGIYGGT